ncbi:hypothetical protein, partial [Dialister hominis]|jgi:hypothetical protein|uniref:hypothetical protein n=1 Tax=Dialister hominis TaxID=2582419 RepID=UPI003FF092FB
MTGTVERREREKFSLRREGENHTTGLCPRKSTLFENHKTKASALRKCNSSARHQNLWPGTFPSRAR